MSRSLLILWKSKEKLWFFSSTTFYLGVTDVALESQSFRTKFLFFYSAFFFILYGTVCFWVFQEGGACFVLEIWPEGLSNLAGLKVGMSFISAKSHREGSVDCLFLIQGVVCSVMFLCLHLKLEAVVIVFEMLPSIKTKKELLWCEDVQHVRKEHYRVTMASESLTVQWILQS